MREGPRVGEEGHVVALVVGLRHDAVPLDVDGQDPVEEIDGSRGSGDPFEFARHVHDGVVRACVFRRVYSVDVRAVLGSVERRSFVVEGVLGVVAVGKRK